jgi:hypothetical protein
MKTDKKNSKTAFWTGIVISALIVLFLLFDSISKILKTAATIQGSAEIGWPEESIQNLGLVLLICTILYIIPRTSILGAILLTGYLGGATAIMVRAETAGHPFIFPVVFGVLVWAGIFLRNNQLRSLIPFIKKDNTAKDQSD